MALSNLRASFRVSSCKSSHNQGSLQKSLFHVDTLESLRELGLLFVLSYPAWAETGKEVSTGGQLRPIVK